MKDIKVMRCSERVTGYSLIVSSVHLEGGEENKRKYCRKKIEEFQKRIDKSNMKRY